MFKKGFSAQDLHWEKAYFGFGHGISKILWNRIKTTDKRKFS